MNQQPIHISRLFDIVTGMGSKVDLAAKIVQARLLDILKKAKEEFRSVIDNGTPLFYVLDIDKDIIQVLAKDYPNIHQIRDKIHLLVTSIAFSISYDDFKASIEKAYLDVNTLLANLLTKTLPTHLQYRDIFRQLGQDLAKIFSSIDKKDKRAIVLLLDPEKIGQVGKLVFIGKLFTLVQKNLNAAINTTIRKELDKPDFKYGDYMAAGHTAITTGNSQYGTNTPAVTEALFKLEQLARSSNSTQLDKFKFQNDFVQQVPLFLQHTVDLKKELQFGKLLLDLNFTFVVPMPALANLASGLVEKRAIENLTSTVVMPSLVDLMKQRLAWMKDILVNLRLSPLLVDILQENIVDIFLGKKPKIYKQTYSKTQKLKIANVVVPKIRKLLVPKPKTTKVSVKSNIPKETLNLTNLQNLLNQRLHDQIKANMGTGQSRSTLNYRSGRLAQSAQVERMSESRTGMLTAFYLYMKYPYATFSGGGAQQYPRLRDPKLLIAKSIREIAGTSVANRMRSVNI